MLPAILAAAITFTPYFSIGAGYKVNEPSAVYVNDTQYDYDFGHPLSAQFEIGAEDGSGFSFGYRHRSQWLSGRPFNSKHEYFVDEFFIDKRWSL